MFRIVDDQNASNHKTLPGIDSCFTVAKLPLAYAWGCKLQWAVTPKLTMIDGRQLSIGKLSV